MEKERVLPNQFLADRIAGKVDEKGNPIVVATTETPESVEVEITAEHIEDNPDLANENVSEGDTIQIETEAIVEPEVSNEPQGENNEQPPVAEKTKTTKGKRK